MRQMLAALTVVAALVNAAPAMAQTSYTLWCRGGGSMQLTVIGGPGPATVPGATPLAGTSMRIAFAPMRTAATAATPPGPGQCSWLDRPLNGAEPTILSYTSNDFGGSLATTAVFDGGNFTTLDFSGAGSLVNDARYLFERYRSGQEFRVMVYNNGRGVMKITSVVR